MKKVASGKWQVAEFIGYLLFLLNPLKNVDVHASDRWDYARWFLFNFWRGGCDAG